MASGGHILQQQKPGVEAGIKTLTNNSLKEICKTYGYQVSGTKAVLQKRCLEILEDIVRRGDGVGFDDLKQKAFPSQPNGYSTFAAQSSTSGYQPYTMAPQRNGAGLSGSNRIPTGGKHFKPSPFYEIVDTLLPLQDLPEMPQNRHSVKATLTLRPEVGTQFRTDDLKILLYCGASQSMSGYSQADVAFPNQIEIKINDADIKSNFKGMKNKRGTTKPADLTSYTKKYGGHQNQITVTYALTTKRYAYCIYLVRYIGPDKLVERIKKQSIIRKQKVLDDMNKANADPDIEATSVRMSLKDPVSTMRITLPVRSSRCKHNQCFDGAMFIQLQEQAPQWSCPVCSQNITFESLCVDEYFQDILNRTPKSTEKVDVEPNGQWREIREEDDAQAAATSSRNARASYDDDFEDDIVELDAPVSKQLNGVKRESQGLMLSPTTAASFSINTPPLSSREPSVAQSASSAQRPGSKRPQGVIDLTLSDEDDEPPRPAKRQTTNNHRHSSSATQSSTTNSYNTPASLPDPRVQHLSYNNNQTQQSDAYRPQSNHTRPSSLSNFNAQQAPSPSNPQSPFGQPAWPRQHSRPSPIQQPPGNPYNYYENRQPQGSPFAIRPPSEQGFQSGQSSGLDGQQGGLRLPPMQSIQPSSPGANGYQGGWRSDYDYGNSGSWSQSPE